jgi:hypothetical protein
MEETVKNGKRSPDKNDVYMKNTFYDIMQEAVTVQITKLFIEMRILKERRKVKRDEEKV